MARNSDCFDVTVASNYLTNGALMLSRKASDFRDIHRQRKLAVIGGLPGVSEGKLPANELSEQAENGYAISIEFSTS